MLAQFDGKYQPIDDGNKPSGEEPNRGPNTPSFNTKTKSFLKDAKKSTNKNAKAKEFLTTADKIIDDSNFNASYSPIPDGGVDFSDCVENHYIFETNSIENVSDFWKKYVTNNPK